LVTSQHAEELSTGARQLGVDLTASSTKLLGYLALLIKWNKAYNLTAVRDPDEMVSRHLLDSLSVMSFIETVAGWMWAVAAACRASRWRSCFPEQVTCLDSNGKKTRFLTQVKLELKLDNLQVIHSRVEAFSLSSHSTGSFPGRSAAWRTSPTGPATWATPKRVGWQ
jgi:16S rRNA (guanine527-N7)-methyltransferase